MSDVGNTGSGTGGAGAGGTGAGSGQASGATTAGAAGSGTAVWHEGKIDPTVVGFWQNKGLDVTDPVKVADGLTKFYRESERFIGAPPEEMIRIPKTNAAPADINAYWQRIGVPAEAKDYDLSAVKRADGKELDSALAETLRDAMHNGRVPKDRAGEIASRVIKHLDSAEAATTAERAAAIKTEREALDRNWGTNKAYNEAIAKRAVEEVGKAAGLTPEQTKAAVDALSTVGGIGASYAMEMFRTIGAKLGESPFIAAQPGNNGNNNVMSKAQALAEIESLKQDKGFYKQLVTEKSVAAKQRWDNLHKIAFAA